jgi:riboflavin kinase/FMN adenylyltransferase
MADYGRMWLKKFPEVCELPGGCVLAIGNFDGVHEGHKALLKQAFLEGEKRDLPVVVLTFEPHPRVVLRPQYEFKLLMNLEEKAEALVDSGLVEGLAVLGFDGDVAAWSPQQFVDFIEEWLKPRVVCVGENFRFGAKAAGDVEFLAENGGFEMVAVPLVRDEGGVVSSTRLRAKTG